ncbi:nitrous oxide reductase accessory protein NosL [Bacillus sp. FJAT-42315]|uniref:nitrous oxide reductase accessory protein NosL n=1 Tax=Bacillus sp. FJAT-42315 TaxID=2014077 RepID=UPI001E4790D3|nr:nitrous oxide reductase accessory protein NosL [Bacillus sp. FJAT-42315]
MMKRIFVGLAASAMLLAACGKEQTYEPVEINPDIDVCDVCNMSITEPQYATEVILKDGSVETFDDIGCMVEYLHEQDEKDIGEKYVRDALSGDWVKLNEATFVYNKDYWTPMAYGVVSFSDQSSAEKYMKKEGKGEMMTLDEVMTHDWGGHQ